MLVNFKFCIYYCMFISVYLHYFVRRSDFSICMLFHSLFQILSMVDPWARGIRKNRVDLIFPTKSTLLAAKGIQILVVVIRSCIIFPPIIPSASGVLPNCSTTWVILSVYVYQPSGIISPICGYLWTMSGCIL